MSEQNSEAAPGSGDPPWREERKNKGAPNVVRWPQLGVAMLCFVGMLIATGGGILFWWYWTTPQPILKIPRPNSNVSGFQFSPDGLALAVVCSDGETDIYRVSDGTLMHKLPGGGTRCAWNVDGSLLAVARSNWPDIELWDSKTWTMQKRLSLYDPKKGRPKSDAPYGLLCYSLCFDRWHNLYVVELSAYDWEAQQQDAFPYQFPPASVFWRASDARSDIPGTSLFAPHFVTVATLGEATRLVCSGRGGHGPSVEVWSVQTPKTGLGVMVRKYMIPTLGSRVMPISLTNDGRYLVANGPERFFIAELFNDHADVICAEQRLRRITVLSTIDVAANAPLAACMERDAMAVLKIPSGRSVLEFRSPGWMALSPNGRLVATTDWQRRSVRIYRAPDR